MDPLVYRKMSLNITLLEGGILFHSVFVGMTISITVEGFIILLIAILFHQMFEGLGLGSRIAAVPYPEGKPSTLDPRRRLWNHCPHRPSHWPHSSATAAIPTARLVSSSLVFSTPCRSTIRVVDRVDSRLTCASSSGLLLYAALVDLLAEDFLSEEAQRIMTKKDKTTAFHLSYFWEVSKPPYPVSGREILISASRCTVSIVRRVSPDTPKLAAKQD